MTRRLAAAALCALAPIGVALAAPAGAGVLHQRSPSIDAQASALRHQIRVERVRAQRAVRQARRALLARPSVDEAIHLSAVLFGVDEGRMRMVIGRESGFRPWAKNPNSTASGLGQFLDSTWASTPCGKAGLSVFSAYANALCMGWTIRYGGGWSHWSLTAG